MRNKSIIILTLFAAAAAGTVSAPRASARTISAIEVYWKCPSGFTFETSGNAVHCKKPSWTEVKPFVPCGFPSVLKLDLVGQTDMCAGSTPVGIVSTEPGCYASDMLGGFTKRRVEGKDFCGKNHPVEIVAPSQAISL